MRSTDSKRISITVPESTLRLLDRVARKGDRSAFITAAVHAYVAGRRLAHPRAELEAGAKGRAARDLALSTEWSALDDGTWPGREE